jgi:hypothetical protein
VELGDAAGVVSETADPPSASEQPAIASVTMAAAAADP